MDRKPISELIGITVRVRLPTTNEPDAIRLDQLILARIDNGQPIAKINRDALFDRDGNYFHNDA